MLSQTIISSSPTSNIHIQESKSILDVLKHATTHSFVLLDLDNTCMESKVPLGTDQWFEDLVEEIFSKELGPDVDGDALALEIYSAVQNITKTQLVEKEIAEVLHALREKNIPFMGLTARGTGAIDATLRQLAEVKLSFNTSGLTKENHEIDILGSANKAIFKDGILFCNANSKGMALKAFLTKNNLTFTHFVMADDKIKHLHAVSEIIKMLGAEFYGLHYLYCQPKVLSYKDLHKTQTKKQLRTLYSQLPEKTQQALTTLDLLKSPPAQVVNAHHFFHHHHAPPSTEATAPGRKPNKWY